MIRLAFAVAIFAAGSPAVSRDGFKLTLAEGWKESSDITAASKERVSPLADGGAVGWEKKEGKSMARVIWLRSKLASKFGVREELDAFHEGAKSESEEGKVVSWDVTETKVLMTSRLTYKLGDPLEGKGSVVRQVAIAGVDKEGKIRGWTLECGYPSSGAAKGEKDCDALAASFAVTLPAAQFRAIEPQAKAP